MLSALLVALLTQTGAAPQVSAEAKEQYRRATDLLSRGDHAGATAALNQLAREYPTWGAIYASRCVAQVGLGNPQYAVEDCKYALRVDARWASPLWWLAEAESSLGRPDEAARHFREYAASGATDVTPSYRDRALRRAAELENPVAPPPPPPAPREAAPRRSSRSGGGGGPTCQMGADGQNACGYNCKMGADGRVACANTPDGTCAMGANGRVTCSNVAVAPSGNDQPTECRMGSDGEQTCGYNCRMGSNGHFYCASVPNGQCRMNSNGTFSCP